MEIELTAQAEADLVEIGDFIAKDNPSAAERYEDDFATGLRYCANFPKRDIVFETDPISAHLSNARLLSCTRLKATGSKFCVSGL